jgi:hypothetical protein
MSLIDIHLAAAAIDASTIRQFEELGFVEDLFRECRNCTPTIYHATYRKDLYKPSDLLWNKLKSALAEDASFNGLLEEEKREDVQISIVGQIAVATPLPPTLEIQACPVGRHKACDVHAGVRLDTHSEAAIEWLEALGIASFQKERPDGLWRIYTATFDTIDAGRRYFDAVKLLLPRQQDTAFKIKFERILRAVRFPVDAVTLPLTYAHQLDRWMGALSDTCQSTIKNLEFS